MEARAGPSTFLLLGKEASRSQTGASEEERRCSESVPLQGCIRTGGGGGGSTTSPKGASSLIKDPAPLRETPSAPSFQGWSWEEEARPRSPSPSAAGPPLTLSGRMLCLRASQPATAGAGGWVVTMATVEPAQRSERTFSDRLVGKEATSKMLTSAADVSAPHRPSRVEGACTSAKQHKAQHRKRLRACLAFQQERQRGGPLCAGAIVFVLWQTWS